MKLKTLFFALVFAIFLSLTNQVKAQTTGRVEVRDSTGKLAEKGRMKKGVKTGSWFIYNSEGWIERKEVYRNGVKEWVYVYNRKHKVIRVIDKNGKATEYKRCDCAG